MTRFTPHPCWIALWLLGCDLAVTGTPPGAFSPDRDAAAAFEPLGVGARPPERAPLPLPDCGAEGPDAGRWLARGADGGLARPPTADAGTGMPAAQAGSGAVVISELMPDPTLIGDTQGEWFELHNPGDVPVDLIGCLVDDGGGTLRLVGDSLVVAAGGHVTIARGSTPGFVPDLVMPMSLGNAADMLALSCDGVEIDRVAYGPGFPLAAGVSLSLDPNALDAVSNDDVNAWCRGAVPYALGFGTPGAENPPCGGGDDGGV